LSAASADFVALLRRLGAAGVVAGHNYRFGFRASGDVAALQALCGAAGLTARIVDMVTAAEAAAAVEAAAGGRSSSAGRDEAVPPAEGPTCALQVSSTGVRAALAAGDVALAAALLGRRHRVVLGAAAGDVQGDSAARWLLLPPASARNQPPREGRAYAADAAMQLRSPTGAPLWAAGGVDDEADASTAAAAPPLRTQLEPLPGGAAQLTLLDAADDAAVRQALAAAPPGEQAALRRTLGPYLPGLDAAVAAARPAGAGALPRLSRATSSLPPGAGAGLGSPSSDVPAAHPPPPRRMSPPSRPGRPFGGRSGMRFGCSFLNATQQESNTYVTHHRRRNSPVRPSGNHQGDCRRPPADASTSG
jgi:hypothetical protein